MGHFHDDEHALRMGMLMGSLMKADFSVTPIRDDEGNYTSVFIVHLPDEEGLPPIEIRVQVLG